MRPCTRASARTRARAVPPSVCAPSSHATRAPTSVRRGRPPLTERLCCRSPGVDGICDDAPVRERTEIVRHDEYLRCRSSTLPAFDFAKTKEKKTRQMARDRLNVSLKNRKCKSNDVETDVDRGGDVADGEELHCEFSEQSNVEEFGPLPESVFEAIEDSQECREAGRNFDENEIGTDRRRDPSPADELLESRSSEAPSSATNETRAKGGKTRKCPKCDKAYAAASSYFYHLKYSHNQTKDHECEVCGKRFGSRASLSAHGSVHSGERRHACEQCGKRFRSAAGLYIHAQSHSGVKAHGCSWCARSFRWRAHLQRHERRHRGERPHACPACPRAFAVRADLLRHARTHAAGAHACAACGDTFAQPRYLRVHVVNKHSGASPARNDSK